ncbi:MAG: ABC transporter permease, partial [Oscillospiraceae bacterium]|nr:ABC transporter permease [Oscillospiraceae bacterium]
MNIANKSIIRKLTSRFLKAGRTRNIVAIAAIVLTSVMFTSVFTIGSNMLSIIQNDTMRQVGTRAHGGLKYLTVEQYEHLTKSPLLSDISYTQIFGAATNDALNKVYNEIYYGENDNARWRFSVPTTGNMPQSVNEIACSAIVLDALGVPYEIGAEVYLEYMVGSTARSDTFTLSGFWEGDAAMPAQFIWLSKGYVDSALNDAVIMDNYTGTINAEFWFSNSYDIEGKIRRLIDERGLTIDDKDIGINWAYAASDIDFDPAMIAICVLVLALIL